MFNGAITDRHPSMVYILYVYKLQENHSEGAVSAKEIRTSGVANSRTCVETGANNFHSTSTRVAPKRSNFVDIATV